MDRLEGKVAIEWMFWKIPMMYWKQMVWLITIVIFPSISTTRVAGDSQ
jgi:hypothetical protein